jgi:DNA-binding NarL/FixJ family response regulator
VLALLNRPRLVILDELTQGLDPASRRNVWAAIRQLHEAGTTVLLVTHEMDEAEALCDRIVVMRSGRVLDAGTPAELVNRHARTATVWFSLARPPGSLLDSIGRLAGVHEVRRDGPRITVRGDRQMIAHVGSALVRHGTVPADLGAQVPGLDDALLRLLEDGREIRLGGGPGAAADSRQGAWLDPAVTGRVLAIYRSAPPPARADPGQGTLTGREREVLALIGQGKTNTEIAAELVVGEGTVKTHVNHVFGKLQLRDRAAAVVYAFDHDLVSPSPGMARPGRPGRVNGPSRGTGSAKGRISGRERPRRRSAKCGYRSGQVCPECVGNCLVRSYDYVLSLAVGARRPVCWLRACL